jgi:hypothetical protein
MRRLGSARGGSDQSDRGGEQGAIGTPELRAPSLTTQNLGLMAEYEQLDIFDLRITTTTGEQAEQNPDSEVQQGEAHAAILAAKTPAT